MIWLKIVWATRSDWTDRQKEDYYATDSRAIADLNNFINIDWVVWENACWEWNLSKELEKIDTISKVISTDLIDRWYWERLDFLNDYIDINPNWIISNPPYKFWKQWIEKSLEKAPNVAMLMKLVFLESVNRYEFFQTAWLKKVLVYSKRLWVYKDNIKTKNSWLIAYAWFVFERGYKWKAEIEWIL